MADTGMTLAKLANALKLVYGPKIVQQLYYMTPFYSKLRKTVATMRNEGQGLYTYIPINIREDASITSISEGGVLPSAKTASWIQLAVPLTYTFGTVEFTSQTLKASQSSKGSFGKVTQLQIDSMLRSFKVSMDRQFTNGNTSGMLCMTSSAGGGATSTVDVDNPGTNYLSVGMPIYSLSAETSGTASADVDISQGLADNTAYRVFSIDSATEFTLGDAEMSAAVTTEKWSDNRYIFRYGSANKESMGLKGIVDNDAIKASSSWFQLGTATTTYFGQSRDDYPVLDATILHASGVNRALNEDLMLELLDKVETETGYDTVSPDRGILSNHALRRKFFAQLYTDRRYTPNTVDLKGGFKTLSFQYQNEEIPWITTKMALPNAVFALDFNTMAIHQAGEFEWENYNGQMFEQKVDSSGRYAAYVGSMGNYMNLACTAPKKQGAIRDLEQ